jgi:hypothetical protein
MAICGKHIIAAAYILFFISILSLGNFSLAAANNVPTGLDKAFNTQSNMPLEVTAVQGSGYNTTANFKTIISKIITMALELMGVIFLILGIYGGYTWMTAGGNEEAVEKAKKTIVHAVIGLVIVLAAYAISRFVVETIGGLVFTK